MKIVKYAFYRIYNFYLKRWPKYDPEIYAGVAVSGVLLFIIGLGQKLICRLVDLEEFNFSKKHFFPLLIIYAISSYFIFIKEDKYKKYISPENYENQIYQGWKGDLLFVGFMLMPLLLIAIDELTD